MDGITRNTLVNAAAYVEECSQHAEIHTVTLMTNGQHGGIDLTVEGYTHESVNSSEAFTSEDEYKRMFVIS